MKALVRPTYFLHFANGPTDAFVEALLDYTQTCAANGYDLTTSAAPMTSTISSTTSIANSSTTAKTTTSSFTPISSPAPLSQPSSQRAGLSARAKAGVGISVVIIIIVLALGVIFLLKRRKKSQLTPLEDATPKFESLYPDAIELDPAPIGKLATGGQSLQELHGDHREMARGISTAGNERFTTSSLYQQQHPMQDAYSTKLPTALVELPVQQLPQSLMQRRKPLAELQAQTF
jgi:hypothetical protein